MSDDHNCCKLSEFWHSELVEERRKHDATKLSLIQVLVKVERAVALLDEQEVFAVRQILLKAATSGHATLGLPE